MFVKLFVHTKRFFLTNLLGLTENRSLFLSTYATCIQGYEHEIHCIIVHSREKTENHHSVSEMFKCLRRFNTIGVNCMNTKYTHPVLKREKKKRFYSWSYEMFLNNHSMIIGNGNEFFFHYATHITQMFFAFVEVKSRTT